MSHKKKLVLKITGMKCEGCAKAISRAVSNLKGILHIFVDYSEKKTTIEYDGNQLTKEVILDTIEKSGYGLEEID